MISNKTYAIRSRTWMVRDIPRGSSNPHELFGHYSNDIYQLLLQKLEAFSKDPKPTSLVIASLEKLLQEFIKTRRIMAGEDVNIR